MQRPAEQVEPPLPVPLGGRLVVDAGAQREHEAVLGAGVPLDAVRRAGGGEGGLQDVDDALGGPLVDLGAGEIAFAANAGRHQVGGVGPVGDQVGPVDRCDGLDALGISVNPLFVLGNPNDGVVLYPPK